VRLEEEEGEPRGEEEDVHLDSDGQRVEEAATSPLGREGGREGGW
jgi:hypothetical protein